MLGSMASLDTYGLWRIKYIQLICSSIKLWQVKVSHNTTYTVSFISEAKLYTPDKMRMLTRLNRSLAVWLAMLPGQVRNSGDGKHKRGRGGLYRCLKCVLLCLLSSERFISVHCGAAVVHSMPHIGILLVYTSVPLAGTRLHTIP